MTDERCLTSCFLPFSEDPLSAVLAQQQTVGVELVYLQADVGEGLEAEVLFYQQGVGGQAFGGYTLYEDTVAPMLEVAIYVALVNYLQSCDRS